MKEFYIKQIEAVGNGKKLSKINFTKGLNIVCGPSNTGKSFVINIIDYVFGSQKPSFDTLTGYDTFSVLIEIDDGYNVRLTRKLDKNEVSVDSDSPEIESKAYKIRNHELSDLILKLMGINEEHQIISSQDKKKARLTLRTFIHTFLIDEESVISKKSIVLKDNYSGTGTLSALLFLINGEDASGIEKNESPDVIEAKKKAVAGYIRKQIKEFEEKEREIKDTLTVLGDNDIKILIEKTIEEIAETESKVVDAVNKSKLLAKNICELSAELEETEFLTDRYNALETQYLSDIKRLGFIIEGEKADKDKSKTTKCPFCEGDIKAHIHRSYENAAKAELEKVMLQVSDLKQAKADLTDDINNIKEQIERAEKENDEIITDMEMRLKPHINELNMLLENYKHTLKLKNETEFIRSLAVKMNADIYEVENEEESNVKYNVKDKFEKEFIDQFNEYLDEALKECSYKDYLTSRIDMASFDIVVNAGKKQSEGKGYRGFLNTVFGLVMMKYLSLNAKYSPNILIIDSPITNLTEAEGDESKKNNMKKSLFEYFIKNSYLGQIIVAENKIPDIDYKDANIIRFTKNENKGRYGFLINPYISEEK